MLRRTLNGSCWHRKTHCAILKQVYIKLENFSITFIDAEDYVASEKWQKIFISISMQKCKSGAAVKY
jgi:hypothetical protein